MSRSPAPDATPLQRVLSVRSIAAGSFDETIGIGIFGLPALIAAVLGPTLATSATPLVAVAIFGAPAALALVAVSAAIYAVLDHRRRRA